jgi:hypothetical protein
VAEVRLSEYRVKYAKSDSKTLYSRSIDRSTVPIIFFNNFKSFTLYTYVKVLLLEIEENENAINATENRF